MKKLYLVCLVTLIAVFVDIVCFHSGTVRAQTTQQVHLQRVKQGRYGLDGAVADVTGTIVGFSCHDNEGSAGTCYLAVIR